MACSFLNYSGWDGMSFSAMPYGRYTSGQEQVWALKQEPYRKVIIHNLSVWLCQADKLENRKISAEELVNYDFTKAAMSENLPSLEAARACEPRATALFEDNLDLMENIAKQERSRNWKVNSRYPHPWITTWAAGFVDMEPLAGVSSPARNIILKKIKESIKEIPGKAVESAGEKAFKNGINKVIRNSKYLVPVFNNPIVSVVWESSKQIVAGSPTACADVGDAHITVNPESGCKPELTVGSNVIRTLADDGPDRFMPFTIPRVCEFYNKLYEKFLKRPKVTNLLCDQDAVQLEIEKGVTQSFKFRTTEKTVKGQTWREITRIDVHHRRGINQSTKRLVFENNKLHRSFIKDMHELLPLKLVIRDISLCCALNDEQSKICKAKLYAQTDNIPQSVYQNSDREDAVR